MTAVYTAGMIVLLTVFYGRAPHMWAFLLAHGAILAATVLLVGARGRVIRFLRDFELLPFIVAFFFMNCLLVHRVHPVDYDDMLIRWDRAIGGLALLKSMESISSPWLNDLAKLSWIAYYGIPFFPGIPLYRRGIPHEFNEIQAVYALGFLLNFAGYYAMPAQGPGYFQAELGIAQPKWEESAFSRETKKTIHALEGEARDTFPSGHVATAMITILMLLRHRLWKAAAFGIPVCVLVMLSTIYLRYHYLSDVIAGILLGILCVAVGTAWVRRRNLRLTHEPSAGIVV